MSDLTRRSVLRGLAAGVTVVGWSALDRSWVAAGASTTGGVEPLPRLDGTVVTAPDTLASFGGDFGRLVTGTPQAVLRPGSARDIAKMVGYARRNGLSIAMNGQSGTDGQLESHSNLGQALVTGGIAIDARGLSTIHAIDGDVADVDAGVTWAELGDAAAASGLTPPMLTDFIHLSIGGTLSVGGIGGTMQHAGAQVDTVRELQVVTGEGELVTCSRHRRAGLFNAVLAGAGQCAVIVRAKVALVPAATDALVFNLFYDDLDTYIADQLLVLGDGRFDYQEGQIVRRPDDSGWRYMMEVASYYTPPDAPDQDALLAGLSDVRADAVVLTPTYQEWAHRLDPVVAALKGAGFWDQVHPWLTVFVPAATAAQFVAELVAELTPADLGAGVALLFPFSTAPLRRPLFVVPRSGPASFALTLLRFPFPGPVDSAGMLAQNRALFDRAVALGGKRYIIGAVPDMSAADWRAHYGGLWHDFAEAKGRFDPDGVLTPGQGIFA
ncbi:MAG TPA: FAD-binding protein [Acidimicrobiales bacterium]|nr:FAD-binding protein [Acidimicrobiales bacterium]